MNLKMLKEGWQMLSSKFFKRIGLNTRDKYRKHIFAKARDVYGKTFKGYSNEYGRKKRAGELKRQSARGRTTTAPIASGDLLLDFGSHFKTSKYGFEIGWAAQGAKIKWLKNMGRELTTPEKPIPDGIKNYLSTEVHKEIKRNLGGKKTKIHKIG